MSISLRWKRGDIDSNRRRRRRVPTLIELRLARYERAKFERRYPGRELTKRNRKWRQAMLERRRRREGRAA